MSKSIRPIRTAAAHDVVLEQLRRSIGLGRFLPGDKLPPERSLALQLGVSRTTLRTALQVLVADGTVEVRRGAHGGVIVRRRPSADASAGDLDNVFAFRIANERAAVRLAAVRRTERDLAGLRRILSRLTHLTETRARRQEPDNVPRFIASDVEFHLAIAEAARNPLLSEAVERALAIRFLSVGAVFPALHDDANDGHAEILAAIEARNPGRADRAMARHIERTHRAARSAIGLPTSG